MSWTGIEEVRGQLDRLWERGKILGARLKAEEMFPLRLRTSRPGASDLSQSFEKVRQWIKELEGGSKARRGVGYEIEWVEVCNRQLGRNRIPAAIVIPSEHDALALIGKGRQAEKVSRLAEATRSAFPQLQGWIADHSLVLLENSDCWERVLAVLAWFCQHQRPGIYLRQIDVPGVDTKFVESRKKLIAELLDQVLPKEAIDDQAQGAAEFARRYGLRSKPELVRFRILDERLRLGGLSDISAPFSEVARLKINIRRVFITENQINGLAFPDIEESMVFFGLGYWVEGLAKIDWLKTCTLIYWGDIDTHGFAMLDRLRRYFSDVRSLLMDRQTLLNHRELWVREEDRHSSPLPYLTEVERALYDDLRLDRLGSQVRLEQERIGFGWLQSALENFIKIADAQ